MSSKSITVRPGPARPAVSRASLRPRGALLTLAAAVAISCTLVPIGAAAGASRPDGVTSASAGNPDSIMWHGRPALS